MSRKLNADQKHARRAGEISTFIRQYGRKAQKNCEPNDRRYNRKVESRIRRMSPEELDQLLREDERAQELTPITDDAKKPI